jgi:hypothetical protein
VQTAGGNCPHVIVLAHFSGRRLLRSTTRHTPRTAQHEGTALMPSWPCPSKNASTPQPGPPARTRHSSRGRSPGRATQGNRRNRRRRPCKGLRFGELVWDSGAWQGWLLRYMPCARARACVCRRAVVAPHPSRGPQCCTMLALWQVRRSPRQIEGRWERQAGCKAKAAHGRARTGRVEGRPRTRRNSRRGDRGRSRPCAERAAAVAKASRFGGLQHAVGYRSGPLLGVGTAR